MSDGPLGILAGGGALPRRLIEACAAIGRPVHVIAFDGQTDTETTQAVPHDWLPLGAAGGILDALRAAGVRDIVMAGKIARPSFWSLRPDAKAAQMIARIGLKALGDDGLLNVVAREFEREGFRLMSASEIMPATNILAPEGLLTRAAPDEQAEADIARGFEVAAILGRADVGQAVVVQQGLVLAVEAIEGTDGLIERCRELARSGPKPVLVKCAKPGQDSRLDPPAIGPATVRAAALAGFGGIAVQAGRTLMIDREALVEEANGLGLFVVGRAAS